MTLRERRIALGLGPDQAARQIGISYRALLRAEGGVHIHTRTARKIVDFYGLEGREALTAIDQLTGVEVPA